MYKIKTGYSLAQVSLHWIIAALVLFQLIMGEDATDYRRAVRKSLPLDPSLEFSANLHVYFGIAILVLVVARLALRITYGVPTPVPAPKVQMIAGEALHYIFYILLFAQPITGLITQYHWLQGFGQYHHLGKPVFIVLILVHAGAALYHHFIVKDNVLKRMLKPGTV